MGFLSRLFGKAEPPSVAPGTSGPTPGAINLNEIIGNIRPETNAVIEGAAGYLHRNVAEPSIYVYRKGKDTPDLTHPAYLVWEKPFRGMTGRGMLKLAAVARMLYGDYYFIPTWANETRSGPPIGLRFASQNAITPDRGYAFGGALFQDIKGWYYMGQRFDVAQVVHGMLCPDPNDPFMSKNPIRESCKWWIGADNELAQYQYWMLVNPIASTVLITPGTPAEEWDETSVGQIKDTVNEQTTRHRRGKMVVLGREAKAQDIGIDQSKQALDKVAAIPQERIAAAVGIPLAAIGMSSRSASGLADQGAMVDAARKAATLDYLVPFWVDFAELLTTQFLPLFGGDATGYEFRFDLSTVRTLQDMELSREAQKAKIANPGTADQTPAKQS